MTASKCCTRCGRERQIEKHHILPKSEGGKDKTENLKNLCKDCHDFTHAERTLKQSITYYEKRLALLHHRLEVLCGLNAIDLVKEIGYRSYWLDETTHGDRQESKKWRRKNRK